MRLADLWKYILAVVIACALSYGGISLFVVSFVVVPVAAALFRRAEIPHRLIPATVALGTFVFTMPSIPWPVGAVSLIACEQSPLAQRLVDQIRRLATLS